jgi:hypothetical protein
MSHGLFAPIGSTWSLLGFTVLLTILAALGLSGLVP